jgi:hypothetical protein
LDREAAEARGSGGGDSRLGEGHAPTAVLGGGRGSGRRQGVSFRVSSELGLGPLLIYPRVLGMDMIFRARFDFTRGYVIKSVPAPAGED